MRSLLFMGASTLLALAACAPQGGAQVISGTAALSTFPLTPSKAIVLDKAGKTVAEAAVASDGTFRLEVPTGRGLAIHFAAADGGPALVFPRKSGTIDARFDVRSAAAPFDLGGVRYVGDPTVSQYTYQSQALTADEPADGDGDGECNDGLDPSGAVCVDDDDDENATCEEEDDGGVDCEDGIDSATGAECDGGPAANSDDGDGDGEADDEAEGGVDCEDGIDTATGAECDGGPAANSDDGEAADDEADSDGESDDDDGETNDAPPSEAAVADHNLPSSIGCDGEASDGDGETEDDGDSSGNGEG